ncbi:glycosyltransferase family 2 protein [Palaeococcus ferrophilus]|uniref:glycosyltransferase family 2 protein n=1 Tax=Palaeococcus ferrophilus TaxID=83868 RepID=UPI00064FA903|nr:glycosyltransferase family 2 protein [Palaeococcus ferrophilus]
MSKVPRVSIIILNWNGWRDTIECLESLYRITYPNYDVIVVDNGSEDDSVQKIKEYAAGKIKVNSKFFEYNPYNKPIKVFEILENEAKQGKFNRPHYGKFDSNRRMILIKNEDNYGFAGGNNVGIKFALSVLNPDYVLLLNNDTVVDPNFLIELIKVAESDEKIGIVGPKIYYYDYNGRDDVIWFAGGELSQFGWFYYHRDQKIAEKYSTSPTSVDWITGASMLLKVNNLGRLTILSQDYFFGNEDVDLCIHASKRELINMYVPKAKIWHKVGVARKKVASVSPELFIKTHLDYIKLIQKHSDRLSFFHRFLHVAIKISIGIIILSIKHRDSHVLSLFLDSLLS